MSHLRRYIALILAIILFIPTMGNIVHAEASLIGIKTIAGTGYAVYGGDGGLATEGYVNNPTSIEEDSVGNIYIADSGNNRIRKIDTDGKISTIAGTWLSGYNGDGMDATEASLWNPTDIEIDGAGNIYIADSRNKRIRKIDVITGIITTIAGNGPDGYNGDGGLAIDVYLHNPTGIEVDSAGNIYIADGEGHRIRKIDGSTGIITTIAGVGVALYLGDGETAKNAGINNPTDIEIDSSGNIYIADSGNHRIRKISTDGIITTIAGDGSANNYGDGYTAMNAALNNPTDIEIDGAGNIYIADSGNNKIRKIGTDGIITTIAGNGWGDYTGDGAGATATALNNPKGIEVDADGKVYIADTTNHRIRKVVSLYRVLYYGNEDTGAAVPDETTLYEEGERVLVKGNTAGLKRIGYSFMGWNTKADASGTNYAAKDTFVMGTEDLEFYAKWTKLPATYAIAPIRDLVFIPVKEGYSGGTQEIKTIEIKKTGTGDVANLTVELSGTDVDSFELAQPIVTTLDETTKSTTFTVKAKDGLAEGTYAAAIKITAEGQAYEFFSVTQEIAVGDPSVPVIHAVKTGEKLVEIEWSRVNGATGYKVYKRAGLDSYGGEEAITGPDEDGYTAAGLTAGEQYYFAVKAVKPEGDSQYSNEVSGIAGRTIIKTIAGIGVSGYKGDGGYATSARISFPRGMDVDDTGNIYIADQYNHRIRKVGTDGNITTIAGTGLIGYDGGEGIAATLVHMAYPSNIAAAFDGSIYVVESGVNKIRKIDAGGIMTTIAGVGAGDGKGYNGDGITAVSAKLNYPTDIALDDIGNIYVADLNNHRIRKIDTKGIITTIAGTGSAGYNSDGIPATAAQLNYPTGIEVDAAGNIYVADSYNNRIRKIGTDGNITTIAGTGAGSYYGDGVAAVSAQLNHPYDITMDSIGNIYIVEASSRVRKIGADGIITTIAGTGDFGYNGDGITSKLAQLNTPTGISIDSAGNTFIADFNNHRIRKLVMTNAAVYDGNGNTGGAAPTDTGFYEEGESILIADNSGSLIKEGHIFAGWNTRVDGSGMDYVPNGAIISGDTATVLYAKWIPMTYTIESIQNKVFIPKKEGYAAGTQETKTIEIKKTGTGNLANLAVELKGPDADSFEITKPAAAALDEATEATTFTIKAKDGMQTGVYTATVSITAMNMAAMEFAVTQEITIGNPTEPTVFDITEMDRQVSIKWSGVVKAASYNVYFSSISGSYGSETATVTDEVYGESTVTEVVYGYTATGLQNGIDYFFVVRATNSGGNSGNSNEVKGTPRTVPQAPTNVQAIAGDGRSTVTFSPPSDNGGSPINRYIVTSSPGNIIATGTQSPVTVMGLSNNTEYTFTVKAVNAAGAGQGSEASNKVTPISPPNGGDDDEDDDEDTDGDNDEDNDEDNDGNNNEGGNSKPESPSIKEETKQVLNPGVRAQINGKEILLAVVATIAKNGENTMKTIQLNDNAIAEIIQKEGSNSVIRLQLEDYDKGIEVSFSGESAKAMGNTGAVIEIVTDSITYTLPLAQINMDKVLMELNAQGHLADIKVNIKIAAPSEEMKNRIKAMASSGNYQIVADPVEFEITCYYDDKKVEVSSFSIYVERTIAIPEGTDPTKITTAVVLNSDGSVSHVPTRIEQINGKYYARIKSRTNSIYLLIYNPCEFVDTKAHWGREAIDDMGSRLIAGGIGNHKYDPDRYITRAEFTAIIVKALGLKRSTEDNAFTDVKAKNWYADYIGTAWEYKLITGNDYSRFNPMKEITREEAMIIIERAMKLTGLMTELKSGEAEAELAGFSDETQISEWARNSAVSCIRAGLVSGRNGVMLAPRDNITRAEAAVIIRRLLQKSGFIQ